VHDALAKEQRKVCVCACVCVRVCVCVRACVCVWRTWLTCLSHLARENALAKEQRKVP
jgi:hypothetical protein